MREYVVVKPIMDVPAEKIEVVVDDGATEAYFSCASNSLYINSKFISAFISKGIIREKKSANEELAEKICSKYWESGDCRVQRLYTVILEELEKAQTKPAWSSVKPDFPCLFVARIKSKWGTSNMIFSIENRDGYLQLIDNDGMEDDSLENLQADEYIIIERH